MVLFKFGGAGRFVGGVKEHTHDAFVPDERLLNLVLNPLGQVRAFGGHVVKRADGAHHDGATFRARVAFDADGADAKIRDNRLRNVREFRVPFEYLPHTRVRVADERKRLGGNRRADDAKEKPGARKRLARASGKRASPVYTASMLVGFVALAAFAATLVGGAFAVRFRDHLHLILGFSAGAVAGVAFFDLLPEAMDLSSKYVEPRMLTLTLAGGFLLYLVLDRLILLHTHEEDAASAQRGFLGAGTLAIHSFLDGVAIGVGFQASAAVGLIIAAAVLTHDFSDGINTVNVILKNGGERAQAFRWLFVDAIAPAFGVASTLLFAIPEKFLGLALAVFAGFFLYLSASDLIPESHHRHPRIATTLMTLAGALLLYVVVALAG